MEIYVGTQADFNCCYIVISHESHRPRTIAVVHRRSIDLILSGRCSDTPTASCSRRDIIGYLVKSCSHVRKPLFWHVDPTSVFLYNAFSPVHVVYFRNHKQTELIRIVLAAMAHKDHVAVRLLMLAIESNLIFSRRILL